MTCLFVNAILHYVFCFAYGDIIWSYRSLEIGWSRFQVWAWVKAEGPEKTWHYLDIVPILQDLRKLQSHKLLSERSQALPLFSALTFIFPLIHQPASSPQYILNTV